MTIVLTPKQEAIVRRLIDSGRYGSEADAVGAALERLEADERLYDDIRRKVGEGIAEAERGDLVEADEVFDRLNHNHEAPFGKQDWR